MLYAWEVAAACLFPSDDRTRVLSYAKFKRLTLEPKLIFNAENRRPMIEAVTTAGIQHLIIPEIDRLGRKSSDVHSEFVYLTGQIGLTLHVIDLGGDSYSSDNPANKSITGVLATCACLERNSSRKAFAAQKIKNQEPVGAVSFGWKIFDHETVRMVVPDEEEQRWLKKIIQWRQAHQWPYAKIAHELNQLGVKSKQGGKWHKGTIYKLFRNLHVQNLIQDFKPAERYDRPSADSIATGTHRPV